MSPPQQLRQQTSNCSSLLIYRPRKDERLSWPSWLTNSGWLTHISGHPSAASREQDSERTPAKDRCSTAGLHNQLTYLLTLRALAFQRQNSKSGQSNWTTGSRSPPHMHGSVVIARLRQCAPPSNICFLEPTRLHIQNGISIGSDGFAQSTAGSLYTLQWAAPFSLLKLLLHSGYLDPSNTWFLEPTRVHSTPCCPTRQRSCCDHDHTFLTNLSHHRLPFGLRTDSTAL